MRLGRLEPAEYVPTRTEIAAVSILFVGACVGIGTAIGNLIRGALK